ncbi:Xylose isomerase [Klebsormidium nitens]|uniref:Xylose isomerase n=1 Tax=Klebsormidium nitens TaxID=105231 RepID=A0A0U9HTC7_KLENI|nr:Xylose isomerase [Klebsormidium nitens]|eukprot:GAQ77611.1 Xylose isomerase [Klebsormidium nitens]
MASTQLAALRLQPLQASAGVPLSQCRKHVYTGVYMPGQKAYNAPLAVHQILRLASLQSPPQQLKEGSKSLLGSRSPSSHRQPRIRATASDAEPAAPSNLIGVHWLTWAGGLSEEECRKAIDGSAKLGYDLVEVPLGDPDAVNVPLTRRMLQEANMAATASLGLLPHADVSSDDSEIAAAGEKLLEEAVKVAAGIGATIVTGITYSALHKYPSGPTVAGRRNSVVALKRIAARAADSGIEIGLEVVNRYESNLINTAAEAMELLSEIDHPGVMVHLDSYHMNIEENSAAEAVQTCGDKLRYVHIGESHRGYLGTGSVDFPALFAALAAARYRGPITFESFSSRVVNPQLSNTLCIWRNLWEDSEDLAQHAKAFIDEKWNP